MADDTDIPSPPAVRQVIEETTARLTTQVKKRPWLPWAAGGGLLLLVIILLAFGFLFNRRQVSPQTEQWQQYHSDSLGFSVSHPASWTVTEVDAPSGPDIIVTEQTGSAFVRIRGFLDVNLNNTDAIQASFDQYQKILTLQPNVRVTNSPLEAAGEHVREFTITGEFTVADSIYNLEERGMLATTGRVLLIRAADVPSNFNASLPTMRKIMDSFTLEQQLSSTKFNIPSALAAESPQQPLANIGNVDFSITDYQANSVAVTDSRVDFYTNTLRGNIINGGIPLRVRDNTVDQINQLHEENNQLNQGAGGRHLITNQNGETFWGYQKFSGAILKGAYRIDVKINVFHRDASGDRQDLFVTLMIYDSNTGELVGTTTASRKNTIRTRNQEIVGPQPTWWQKYISGYGREITYEDVLRTVISEAASDVVGQLSTFSDQEFVSDADRFAESLEASGYIPIVPDEIRRQSEGRDDQTEQNTGYGKPVKSVQSRCSYQTIQTTGKGYGPRCFPDEVEAYWFHQVYLMDSDFNEIPINHPLSESGIINLGQIIKQNRAEFCSSNPEPCSDIPGGFASISQYYVATPEAEPYVDPELDAWNQYLDCVRYLQPEDDSSHCSALINDGQSTSDTSVDSTPSGATTESR